MGFLASFTIIQTSVYEQKMEVSRLALGLLDPFSSHVQTKQTLLKWLKWLQWKMFSELVK